MLDKPEYKEAGYGFYVIHSPNGFEQAWKEWLVKYNGGAYCEAMPGDAPTTYPCLVSFGLSGGEGPWDDDYAITHNAIAISELLTHIAEV